MATNRMYLVNTRTGHVARVGTYSYSGGWKVIDEAVDAMRDAIQVAGGIEGDGHLITPEGEEWEIGYEGHEAVQKYLNERHPKGARV